MLRSDVTLDHLSLEHAERMWEWMQDPTVRQGIGLRDPEPTLEKTRQWIMDALGNPSLRAWVILLGGEHVGNIHLSRIDPFIGTARLSIYVGPAQTRGTGVGRTAVHLVSRLAFEEMNLHKVWLTVHAENHPAIASYLKAGFVLEGILRDEFLLAGRRVPLLYMGLLREDFFRRLKEGQA